MCFLVHWSTWLSESINADHPKSSMKACFHKTFCLMTVLIEILICLFIDNMWMFVLCLHLILSLPSNHFLWSFLNESQSHTPLRLNSTIVQPRVRLSPFIHSTNSLQNKIWFHHPRNSQKLVRISYQIEFGSSLALCVQTSWISYLIPKHWLGCFVTPRFNTE